MSAVMDQRQAVMDRASRGDAQSFSLLIEPLLDPAYRLAAVMLSDRTAAEDAVQEASIKAWRKIGQLRGDAGSLRAWFLSIVANESRMARRQRWWSVVRLPELERPPDPDDHYSGQSSDLKAALLRLNPDDRLPLVLHFYLDLPLEEVARILRVSPSAAKSRIYRAAHKLRPELSVEEVI
jgi:RNA polymerase sigma-70 factor, ECF subfamily